MSLGASSAPATAPVSVPPAVMTSNHITVLLDEAVDALCIQPGGIYIDGTFGRGGHSKKILSKFI